MAANELFDSGIKVTGSFSAAGGFPVDAKFTVKTIAERDDHVTQNRAYEGMLVYVSQDGKTYQYTKEKTWKEFGFNVEDFQDQVYDGLDSDSPTVALSARQGKVLNTTITTHASDAVKHITSEERTRWDAKADNTLATSAANGLMSKEDKAKLDGVEARANNYVHPANHAATMITEDTDHRFVTDAEKAAWNAKPDDKEDIGLGNVTNDAQVKRSEMGVANGVATLDENGQVPAAQLPSFVDDIVEYDNFEAFPDAGEEGKIYVDKATNTTYRWSGTQYTKIGSDLSLGETASTAYPGNKGKANADEIAKIKDGTTIVPKAGDAATVTGFTVGVNVPADAKFTDTTYSNATTLVDGLMSKEDKAKLDGVEANANNYVHPNDSSTRHVSDAQIAAWDAKASTDLVEAGVKDGLMSKEDKTKLDGIAEGANNYVHPDDANTRHVTDTEKAKWNAKAENTVATVIANGLMSAADKVKLDGIEEGANNYVHPNDSNTRHVTDEQIETWTNKADNILATSQRNGLMSKTDKAKLDGIEISKIENITYTMPATEFKSASKVKIPVSNITVDTVITIGLDTTSLTVEQYNAAGEAKFNPKIVDGGVEVSCFGQLPKIDIPVTLAVVRK